jgi:hypothetical protein
MAAIRSPLRYRHSSSALRLTTRAGGAASGKKTRLSLQPFTDDPGALLAVVVTLGAFENPRINVIACRALECPIFKTFIGGCHAHHFHLR